MTKKNSRKAKKGDSFRQATTRDMHKILAILKRTEGKFTRRELYKLAGIHYDKLKDGISFLIRENIIKCKSPREGVKLYSLKGKNEKRI